MQNFAAESPGAVHPVERAFRKAAIAAFAGAGLMLAAAQSHAITVYSGVVNLNIPSTTNGLYLNVVTGVNNLPTSTAGTTVPGWDINIWNSTGIGFFNPTSPAGGAYVASAAGTVSNLASGTLIGAASTYSNGVSANNAQWVLNSSNNLFGFRFTNEATGLVHYGWGRLSLSNPAGSQPRSLVEYAYESVAGADIAAGFTGVVPEPGTYAMMGVGVVGLLLARRRRRA